MAISRTNRKIYYLKYILTVFLIDTDPFPNPRAKYWPSFVQEHELIRALILNFCTDFCSCDHSAKSEMAHEANKLDVGLYAKHWTASLWLKNGIIYIIFPVVETADNYQLKPTNILKFLHILNSIWSQFYQHSQMPIFSHLWYSIHNRQYLYGLLKHAIMSHPRWNILKLVVQQLQLNFLLDGNINHKHYK